MNASAILQIYPQKIQVCRPHTFAVPIEGSKYQDFVEVYPDSVFVPWKARSDEFPNDVPLATLWFVRMAGCSDEMFWGPEFGPFPSEGAAREFAIAEDQAIKYLTKTHDDLLKQGAGECFE